MATAIALPERAVERLTRPLQRFLHVQSAAGIVLLFTTLLALGAANSALADDYAEFWNTTLTIGVGQFELSYPLWYWVNDGLMTLFFFVIGLEIKRELVWGELREWRNVVLPFAGAVGGAIVPIGLFLTLQLGTPGERGWAIPMATDIAFVVGCLALLGSRVPPGLKIMMLSLAIIDDILAVLVIAAVFTEKMALVWLLGAGVGLAVIVLLNRIGVRQIGIYVLIGSVIWLCTLKSGVHPTVAGALLGLLTPASAWLGQSSLVEVLQRSLQALRSPQDDVARRESLEQISFAATEAAAPLDRLEHALHPWVGFVIMPVFALANAGVAVSPERLTEPLALAVATGLFLGKPLGITLICLLVVRLGWSRLPEGVSWGALAGAACLAGIGFTMALFIASLSVEASLLDSAKAGVLLGSALSMLLGFGVLWNALRPRGS